MRILATRPEQATGRHIHPARQFIAAETVANGLTSSRQMRMLSHKSGDGRMDREIDRMVVELFAAVHNAISAAAFMTDAAILRPILPTIMLKAWH